MLSMALVLATLPMQPSPEFRERARERMEARHAAADSNGDGALDRAEAQALPRLHAQFDAIDVDASGTVSRAELIAHVQLMREARLRQRGGE